MVNANASANSCYRLSLFCIEAMFWIQVNVTYSRFFDLMLWERQLNLWECHGRHTILASETQAVAELETKLNDWIEFYTNATVAEAAVVDKDVEVLREHWLSVLDPLPPWQTHFLEQMLECSRLSRVHRRYRTLEMKYLRRQLEFGSSHTYKELRTRLRKTCRARNICPHWLLDRFGCTKEGCTATHPAVAW